MTIFICLDDRDGMTFNNRRQSRDGAVLDDIFRTAGKGRLLISPFSEKYLSGKPVRVSSDPLAEAEDKDFCFIENTGLAEHLEKTDTLIIYRWNEIYPSDFKLDIEPLSCGFRLSGKYNFVGKAHKKITKEVYKR